MSMYAAGRESGCRCPAKVENRTESAWRRRYLVQAASSNVGVGKEFVSRNERKCHITGRRLDGTS